MLAIISPAKTQNFETKATILTHTNIQRKRETTALVAIMKTMSSAKIAKLMSISKKLADLNYQRYQDYNPSYYTEKNAKQAIYAFQGDVYVGLQADDLSQADMRFAQDHLGILSGLYGVLRPLDLIQPHRLEMGIRLKNAKGASLYDFWKENLVETLDAMLAASGSRVLVNLASNEYFKAVDIKNLNATLLTVDFKEFKAEKYKTVAIFAKRARGKMARFMIQNRVTTPDDLKKFNMDNYSFNKTLSNSSQFIFTRTQP